MVLMSISQKKKKSLFKSETKMTLKFKKIKKKLSKDGALLRLISIFPLIFCSAVAKRKLYYLCLAAL